MFKNINCCFFFFFKQKTAYEMLRSLVGSEMCIRDSYWCIVVMRRSVPMFRGGDLFTKFATSIMGDKLSKNTQLKDAAIKTAQMSTTVDVSRGFRALVEEVRSDINSFMGSVPEKKPDQLNGKSNQNK
eukprot:TRINITY_DN50846_c0_g1_i1.p1 TRINITY_DN50846_c0_g1~~TRINITY_DN50846_c0_g1_i1.p1  ORF type:complete len:128 (+),score=38.80 TRINITY_DN50846_c0_g1_i1:71-454(+)